MTTFTTVEELMQVLDANPHLLEGMRSRLLTRELLELPETVARLTDRVDHLTERMDQLTERVDRLAERVEQVEEQLARLTDQVAQLTERMDGRFNRLADDLTWLKDVGAVTVADKQAMSIAEDLGLEYEKQLTQIEVRDLVRNQDTADIAPGDLRSFRAAHMVIEASDAAGQFHYVAVEVSFTADHRDIDRPIRNAGYLTRFTGKPAHAVVASVRADRRIDDIISSGKIHWHQLRER